MVSRLEGEGSVDWRGRGHTHTQGDTPSSLLYCSHHLEGEGSVDWSLLTGGEWPHTNWFRYSGFRVSSPVCPLHTAHSCE